MKKDFITVTPDSGGSGSTTVTVEASANPTESARSVYLSLDGGGMTRTVSLSQAATVLGWNYYFSVTPTSLSFAAGGESKSVTVTSYRKKVVNGVETSTQENVTWTATISGTGFSKNTDGTTITASSNQSDSRSGSVSYTQGTSGKKASVAVSQAAAVVTWRYQISTTPPTSLSFVADGESKSISVSSGRWKSINGVEGAYEEVPWTATISGTGFSKNTDGTTITAAPNTGGSRTGSVRYEQQGTGGKFTTLNLDQAAAVVTWNYYFSVTPTSLSFAAGGESKSVTVTSYRKKVVNGVETSTQENVNYTVAVTGTGFSGSGKTVTAAANSATSSRTGTATYTQTTSGKSQGVSLSQAAAVVTWNYYFSVTPTSLSFVAGGESKSVTVTSYRKKVINGTETSTQENVNWTPTVSGTGFSVSGSTVTAAANSVTTTRSGTVTYTQTGSGETQGVSLSQAGKEFQTFTIRFIGGSPGESYFLFNGPETPSALPRKYEAIKMDAENYEGTVIWKEDVGLELNFNAGAPSNKDYVFPGDSYSIIATTEFNSWNNCRTGTYTVEAGNPTVGLP